MTAPTEPKLTAEELEKIRIQATVDADFRPFDPYHAPDRELGQITLRLLTEHRELTERLSKAEAIVAVHWNDAANYPARRAIRDIRSLFAQIDQKRGGG